MADIQQTMGKEIFLNAAGMKHVRIHFKGLTAQE